MQQRVRRSHRGNFLRPPGNSPSRWHLTRGLLLCSGVTIQHLPKNVKSGFPVWSKYRVNYPFSGAEPSPLGKVAARRADGRGRYNSAKDTDFAHVYLSRPLRGHSPQRGGTAVFHREMTEKLGAPSGAPLCHLAAGTAGAAAVIVAAAVGPACAVAAAIATAVAAAVAEQQDQDDDPPPVVAEAHVIVAAHNIYLQI